MFINFKSQLKNDLSHAKQKFKNIYIGQIFSYLYQLFYL